jgi:hypothetical protein
MSGPIDPETGPPPTGAPVADELTARDFWGGGPVSLRIAPHGGPTALERLGPSPITVRGRNLADLLRPAYDAMTSR